MDDNCVKILNANFSRYNIRSLEIEDLIREMNKNSVKNGSHCVIQMFPRDPEEYLDEIPWTQKYLQICSQTMGAISHVAADLD